MAASRKPTPAEVLDAFLTGRDLPGEKQRKKPSHVESEIQQQCVQWFRLQYASLALNLFAVGNGGARGAREAAIMKGEGVTAGVADLLLLAPSAAGDFHGLCIEMKTKEKGSRQRDNQAEWQRAVERTGYKYVICRSLDEFREAVTSYIPPPGGRCW